MNDRERVIIDTYEKNERFISKDFLDSIDWASVKKYPLDEKFIPVLLYMRDIEALTDVYYQELRHTPTGKEPVIRRFMDRWREEELTHGDLLNRFLNEAGYPTEEKWYETTKANIPTMYKLKGHVNRLIVNCIGSRFTAVHMTWGAINELSAAQAYKQMWERANHPVLEYILRGIAREEASHIFFYRSMAILKLQESKSSRSIARYIIENYWSPVGQGTKTEEESNHVTSILFDGGALDVVDKHINGALQKFPGLEGTTVVNDRISGAVEAGLVAARS